MSTVSATEAKNRFGEVLERARSEPVRIQRNGRDVAVVVSAEQFDRLSNSVGRTPNPAVLEAHARSVKRFAKVYEALAK